MKAKKLLAGVLTCVMMLTMGMTAFAADNEAPAADQKTVTIKKVYQLKGQGTSPEEIFTLEQVGAGVAKDSEATTAPALGTITGAKFEKGAATVDGVTKEITVALPTYTNVGVYEYTLKEVAGTTAGVTYHPGTIKLVVTVVNGDNGNLRIAGVHTETGNNVKSDTITNTYSANTLKVSKKVEGNLGDKSKYFKFKVTLIGEEGKTYGDSYTVKGGSNAENPKTIKIGDETTFVLKDGDTISIENLPAGVSYTVVEEEATGYTTESTGDTGIISAKNESTAAFTNTKGNNNIDTGINLTTLPYMLIIAAIFVIAALAFVAKRRRFED